MIKLNFQPYRKVCVQLYPGENAASMHENSRDMLVEIPGIVSPGHELLGFSVEKYVAYASIILERGGRGGVYLFPSCVRRSILSALGAVI